METINLKPLVKALRGILDGSLSLFVVQKKKGKAAPAKKGGRKPAPVTKRGRKPGKQGPAKRGRKPVPASVKKQRLLASQRAKIRKEKSQLPAPREIFIFLADKLEGAKLTQVAAHFKVKRSLLKPLLEKLVKKGDLSQMGGKYFLQRRLRGVGQGGAVEKSPGVPEKEILGYLGMTPGATMAEMAKALGGGKYQKLIRVMNGLVKQGKVKKEGRGYRVEG